MSVSRYVPVQVAVVEGKIYPVTELEFVKDSYCGDYYYKYGPGYNDKVKDLVEMVWDCKKKCYKNPFVLEYKRPDTTFGTFTIGDYILVECDGMRKLKNLKLVDIVYKEYDSSYKKFKKLEDYLKKNLTEEDFQTLIPEDLIEVRHYKQTYVFENGYKTTYPHQFYKVEEWESTQPEQK